MNNRSDIQGRMASIAKTRQITKAMHLIAATKVKKDSNWVELTRTYFRRVRSTMRDILESSKGIDHKYMNKSPGNRSAFIVIAGDKGLAGGYNHNVLAFAQKAMEEKNCVHLIAIGSVCRAFFERSGIHMDTSFVHVGQRPYLHFARRIVENIFDVFESDEIDEIYCVYTRYDSQSSQFPQLVKILPVELGDYKNVDIGHEYDADIIYEPSPQAVFDVLVPEFAIGLLFGGMVQSYMSEHTARMNAMDSATQNADEMIKDLSLKYNLARQFAITSEITEIVGAADALNNGSV